MCRYWGGGGWIGICVEVSHGLGRSRVCVGGVHVSWGGGLVRKYYIKDKRNGRYGGGRVRAGMV